MKMKRSRKLLAVVLALAICITTVFGCLMTVFAATASYSFGKGSLSEDKTKATIDVTFNHTDFDDGIYTGQFVVKKDSFPDGKSLALTGVTSNDADKITVDYNTEDITDPALGVVVFDSAEGQQSVTITLGFDVNGTPVEGDEFKLALTDVLLADRRGDTYKGTGNVGTISAGCAHVITVDEEKGSVLKYTDEANGYSVYENAVCSICGKSFDKQVVPFGTNAFPEEENTKTFTDAWASNSNLYPGDVVNYIDNYKMVDSNLTLKDPSAANSESNPYLITSVEELRYIVFSAGSATAGQYYEVPADIKAFYLNTRGYTEATDIETIKTTFSETGDKWSAPGNAAAGFQGHFNGNGVIIAGMRSDDASLYGRTGLFPWTSGEATIKNVKITKSYIRGGEAAGAIVGRADGTKVTVENCSVEDCYIEGTVVGAGAVIGAANAPFTIKNCFIDLDEANFVSPCETDASETTYAHGGLVAKSTQNVQGEGLGFINCIVLGIKPYTTNKNVETSPYPQLAYTTAFKNVYTDQDITDAVAWGYKQNFTAAQIKQLTETQMKGQAAKENMSLDWDTVWFVGSNWDYPSFTKLNANMPASTASKYNTMVLETADTYGESTDTFGMYSTSVNLKANPYIAFTFAFSNAAGYDAAADAERAKMTVTFKTASKTITTVVGTDGWTHKSGAGRYHLYRLQGIPVEDLASPISVSVNYNGTISDFGTFSVEGFALNLENAYRVDPSDYYKTRIDAAKALLFYIQMVNARYGSIA